MFVQKFTLNHPTVVEMFNIDQSGWLTEFAIPRAMLYNTSWLWKHFGAKKKKKLDRGKKLSFEI